LTGHEYYIETLARYLSNMTMTMQPGAGTVFIGDSITNGLSVASIFNATNLGIPGDTVQKAKARIKSYRNLDDKLVVIAIGINDLPRPNTEILNDFRGLMENLPATTTVAISSILPIQEEKFEKHWSINKTNRQIDELNALLSKLAQERQGAFFMETSKLLKDEKGELKDEYHIGDAIHLNELGYSQWVAGLRAELQRIENRN
jgi:lysophospholipase L1-like esterase